MLMRHCVRRAPLLQDVPHVPNELPVWMIERVWRIIVLVEYSYSLADEQSVG
jgi:hypothetical protein